MTSYEIDPFGARKARATATGNKLLEKIFENLIKTEKKEIRWAIKIKKKHAKNGTR